LPRLRYRDRTVQAEAGETVLDALERGGLAPPASCRAGACLSCLVRAERGTPPPKAQRGLLAVERERGLFLACQAVPTEDLDLTDPGEAVGQCQATLVERERLGSDVWRLGLRPERPLRYQPGQFVRLRRPADDRPRAYSLASLPDDPLLELHVRCIEGGQLSPWLCRAAPIGTELALQGPFGTCVYDSSANERLLVLAGTSTGLAPLLGVARDALRSGHRGGIRLYHGAATPDGLYGEPELRALRRQGEIALVRCALDGEAGGVQQADLATLVLDDLAERTDVRVHLAGAPTLVGSLKRRLFLHGIPLAEIRSDPFFATV
jgi:CDP-4-dehydro-6-deoxyglucose reductase